MTGRTRAIDRSCEYPREGGLVSRAALPPLGRAGGLSPAPRAGRGRRRFARQSISKTRTKIPSVKRHWGGGVSGAKLRGRLLRGRTPVAEAQMRPDAADDAQLLAHHHRLHGEEVDVLCGGRGREPSAASLKATARSRTFQPAHGRGDEEPLKDEHDEDSFECFLGDVLPLRHLVEAVAVDERCGLRRCRWKQQPR